jgi:hypothetical protein
MPVPLGTGADGEVTAGLLEKEAPGQINGSARLALYHAAAMTTGTTIPAGDGWPLLMDGSRSTFATTLTLTATDTKLRGLVPS